jgi:hypothetical protein
MKIEIQDMPQGLPPGAYDIEMMEVVYSKGGEPTMRMRFKGRTPPPEPVKYLLVGVKESALGHVQAYLSATPGVTDVTTTSVTEAERRGMKPAG